MRYLENAFKFTFKNFIITLPLLIAMAIPSMIMGVGSLGFLFNMKNFEQIFEQMLDSSGTFIPTYRMFIDLYGPAMIISMIISAVLGLILSILVYPATYGMINKKYETGISTLSDMTSSMTKYIGRYVLYGLLKIAIWIGLVIAYLILVTIGIVVVTAVSKVAGAILLVLFTLAFIAACIALGVYTSLWFTAVCVEDSDILTGLKNSFRYVSGSFGKILGISMLIAIFGSIGGAIIGVVVGWIPIIGGAVSSIVSYLAQFITIVFFFEIYREKSGKYACAEYYRQMNGGI
ncbi:hypothetical protein [Ruminiclostridium cellulolyticum]|uniref:DUF7847 domain-containing protein n=1 Tax=Ruminiclostridium cellulolyticum (strain ATCC 35319 / DSM 5812 / JCM 6584 / H10) TaxID=394503 RepID=B8I308_RUMCH|nr:hypothetical protein [Ruminiclostridium cellulolyticum]ACL76151.1 hypothetical protein Ccel_1801 [Ruminiclostridium cellulolyticum H10]